MAIASASRLEFIKKVVDALMLRDFFNVLVSSDEVQNGKPAPDAFLLAAERLGIAPTDCIVIEDGISGMIGAQKAGMKCVGLLSHVRKEDSPADLNVYDMHELSVQRLRELP